MKTTILTILVLLLYLNNVHSQVVKSDTLTPFYTFKSENQNINYIVFDETNILFEIDKNSVYQDTVHQAIKKKHPIIIEYFENGYKISTVKTLPISDIDLFKEKYELTSFEKFSYKDNKSFKRNESKILKEFKKYDNGLTNSIPIDSAILIFNYFQDISCTNKPNCKGTKPCIPFDYKIDGCYARAHWMCKIIDEKYSYNTQKIFVKGSLIAINSGGCKGKCVKWGYHVAPIIKVKNKNGKTVKMVLDPSLFSKPVTIDEWISAQEKQCTSSGRFGKHKSYKITPSSQFYPSGGVDRNYKITRKIMKKYCKRCH